jgi:hypothetical protein
MSKFGVPKMSGLTHQPQSSKNVRTPTHTSWWVFGGPCVPCSLIITLEKAFLRHRTNVISNDINHQLITAAFVCSRLRSPSNNSTLQPCVCLQSLPGGRFHTCRMYHGCHVLENKNTFVAPEDNEKRVGMATSLARK